MTCLHCGNTSGLRDSKGNCISCGAPLPAETKMFLVPDICTTSGGWFPLSSDDALPPVHEGLYYSEGRIDE